MINVKELQTLAKKNQKVLVTGASGFVGSLLVKTLLEKKVPVVGMDLVNKGHVDTARFHFRKGNLNQPEQLDAIFNEFAITHVIHTAGLFKLSLPYEMLKRVNVIGTENLLNAALKAGKTKAFVHFSSSQIYGEKPGNVLLTEETTPTPDTMYAKSKLESEKVLAPFKKHFDIIVVRPSAIYGPGSCYGLRKIIDIMADDFPVLPLPFGGTTGTNVVHVQDVVESSIHLLENHKTLKYDAYNIADEYPATFSEAAKFIKQRINSKTRLFTVPNTISSIAKSMIRLIPYQLELPLLNPARLSLPTKLEKDDIALMFQNYLFDISRLKDSGYELVYPNFFKGFDATLPHLIQQSDLPARIIDRIQLDYC